MDIQKKKAFEIAFENKLGARGCQFDLDEDGNYEDRETLCSWHMWLEAKAQSEKALLEQFEINNKLVEQIEKLKTQAVPEGFVLVSQKELLELVIAINAVDLATHTEGKPNEVREMWQQVALRLMALGISQEPAND